MTDLSTERIKFHAQGDADEYCLVTNDQRWVIAFRFNGEPTLAEDQERARRVVACWNAAIGIETEALEGHAIQVLASKQSQQRHDNDADAERWRKLCELIDANEATATVNTPDGRATAICLNAEDLTEAIDEANEGPVVIDFEFPDFNHKAQEFNDDDPRALAADHAHDTQRDDKLTGDAA